MELKNFQFNDEANVRIIPVMENEITWFYATDVCKALEIVDTRQAVERLDDDEKRLMKAPDNGQMREMWLISESGLYALVFTSGKPKAKEFRKWVTSEVLPSIRISGRYTQEQEKNRQLAMRQLTKEIDKLDAAIDSHKRETKRLCTIKDSKQKELRDFISANDTQMAFEFDHTKQV